MDILLSNDEDLRKYSQLKIYDDPVIYSFEDEGLPAAMVIYAVFTTREHYCELVVFILYALFMH